MEYNYLLEGTFLTIATTITSSLYRKIHPCITGFMTGLLYVVLTTANLVRIDVARNYNDWVALGFCVVIFFIILISIELVRVTVDAQVKLERLRVE